MISREQAIERIFLPATSRPEQKDELAMVQASGGEHRQVTNAQFEGLILGAAESLRQNGIGSGDRVVMCAPNSPELAAAIAACWALDAIAVPVDVRVTVPELANIVKMLGAKVWLGSSKVSPSFTETANQAVGGAATILDFVDGFPESTKPLDLSKINYDSPAFVILTSGTTGMPKGAVHTLNSLLTNILELGEMAGIDDTMYGVLPLPVSHIFGLEVLWVAITLGTTLVFSELTPTSFIECVGKYKPQVVAGVPTLYGALVAAPISGLDLSRSKLLLSGGAPLPSSLAEEFEKKFGKRINNGYGSTESMIVALNQDGPIESVGRIVPSAKIEIVNDKDEVLPEGEVGEIRIAGPMLMKGYLNMEAETQKVLRNGCYYTGDMGYFKEGRLYIAGRTKEMVIVAGYKVFPVEVEDALRKNPLVKEVAVIGQPHRQLGQIVKAVIVLNDGELSKKLDASPEDKKEARQQLIAQFKDYCKDNLRRELRPMEWDFQSSTNALPKTGTGKIDKKKLETVAV